MSDATFEDLEPYTLQPAIDAVVRARRAQLARDMLEAEPAVREKVAHEARVEEAHTSLRHVLALRRLATSPEDDARIAACADLDTLRRWHDQAVVAASIADALR